MIYPTDEERQEMAKNYLERIEGWSNLPERTQSLMKQSFYLGMLEMQLLVQEESIFDTEVELSKLKSKLDSYEKM